MKKTTASPTASAGSGGRMFQWLFQNKMVNTNLDSLLTSLSTLSTVVLVFIVLFALALGYKLFQAQQGQLVHLNLPLTRFDLMDLKQNSLQFYLIAGYEFLKLGILFSLFWYFRKFALSIDPLNLFKNQASKNFISAVATLGIVYFLADAAHLLHLSMISSNPPALSLSGRGYFHWEYLFTAYFICVFAIVFRRGSELNQEMELVI